MNTITVVITGHGNFATGLASSLALLGNFPENYYAIDFTSEMSEEDLASVFSEIVEKEKKVVFFTDLLGGTPYKEAAKLVMTNKQVELVTGANLGSLLETSFNEYQTAEELANELIMTAKKYTERFINEPVSNLIEDTEMTDGI